MYRFLRFIFLGTSFIFFAVNFLFAQDDISELSRKLPISMGLRQGMLKNGFKYYLNRDPRSNGRLSICFIVKVGEENENDGQLEMAHLLEHVALNSTLGFPDVRFFLSSQGLVWGTDFNGSTGAKLTKYKIFIPDHNTALFKSCLELVRDWATGRVNIDSAVVGAEKGAVLQEIAKDRGDFSRRYQEFLSQVIGVGNHNGRVKLDSKPEFAKINDLSLKRFYKEWYVPEREGLIISGDFDLDSVEYIIRQLFSGSNKKAKRRSADQYADPIKLKGKNNVYFVDKSEGDIECKVVFKNEYFPITTYRDLKTNICRNLLSRLIQNRFRAVYLDDKLKYILNYLPITSEFGRPFSSIVASFHCDSNCIEDTYVKFLSEIFRIRKMGFTQEEFASAKARMMSDVERSSARDNSKNELESYAINFLRGDPIMGRDVKRKITDELISQLTSKDVEVALEEWDFSQDMDVVFFLPSRLQETILTKDTVLAWNRRAQVMPMKSFEYVKHEIDLPVTKPLPPLIEPEESKKLEIALPDLIVDSLGEIGAVSFSLSNGIRVILKSGFSERGTCIRAIKRVKTFSGDRMDSVISNYAPYLVSNSGPYHYTPDEWMQYQGENKIKITHEVKPGSVMISADAKTGNIEAVLLAIRMSIVCPKIDSGLFTRWKGQSMELLQRQRTPSSSTDAYFEALMDELDYTRNILKTERDLERFDIARALLEYKQMYANDGSYSFFICGNFNFDSVSFLLKKFIGTIPVLSLSDNVDQNLIQVKKSNNKMHSYRGIDLETSRVDIILKSQMPVRPCSDVLVKVLRDEFNKMVISRLRSREGVSYSPFVGVSNFWTEVDRHLLTVSFDCTNERVDDAIKYVKEEFSLLKDINTQNDMVSASRRVVASTILEEGGEPRYWADYFTQAFLCKIDVHQLRHCADFANDVTAEEVRDAATSFSIDDAVVYILRAGPGSAN